MINHKLCFLLQTITEMQVDCIRLTVGRQTTVMTIRTLRPPQTTKVTR